MDNDGWIKLFAAGMALSGWFKVAYDHYVSRPKIGGRILSVMTGVFSADGYPKMTSFFVYPYLLNSSKSGVHILDYELYVKCKGEGWIRQKRIYGDIPPPRFTLAGGGQIKFEKLEENLIFKKTGLAQYGVPLHGWAPFLGDVEFYSKEIEKYKLVCIDAYDRKHEILYDGKGGDNPYLLMELGKISLPNNMY